jgi:hypothetical protein
MRSLSMDLALNGDCPKFDAIHLPIPRRFGTKDESSGRGNSPEAGLAELLGAVRFLLLFDISQKYCT